MHGFQIQKGSLRELIEMDKSNINQVRGFCPKKSLHCDVESNFNCYRNMSLVSFFGFDLLYNKKGITPLYMFQSWGFELEVFGGQVQKTNALYEAVQPTGKDQSGYWAKNDLNSDDFIPFP